MTKGITVSYYVGLGFLIVGNILHIVGLATPSWGIATDYYTTYTAGLWKVCLPYCIDLSPLTFSAVQIAAAALSILGMILGLVALTLALVYIGTKRMKKNYNCLPKVNYFLTIMSFLMVESSVTCWGVGAYGYVYLPGKFFGYSFFLCIFGGIFIFISGVLFNCCCACTCESNESVE